MGEWGCFQGNEQRGNGFFSRPHAHFMIDYKTCLIDYILFKTESLDSDEGFLQSLESDPFVQTVSGISVYLRQLL